MTTIGERIKSAREGANLTQAELAAKIGYCAHHISNLECDRYKPSMRTIAAIERALKVNLVK